MKLPAKSSKQELAVFEYVCFNNPILTREDPVFVKWFYDTQYHPVGFKTMERAKSRCSSVLSILFKRGYLNRIRIRFVNSWRYAYFLETEKNGITDA